MSRIALDLGVNPQTLGNWVRRVMSESSSHKPSKASPPNKLDYQALEKELRKAKLELTLKEKEIAVLKKIDGILCERPCEKYAFVLDNLK